MRTPRFPVDTDVARLFSTQVGDLDEGLKPITRIMVAALLLDAANEIDLLRGALTRAQEDGPPHDEVPC